MIRAVIVRNQEAGKQVWLSPAMKRMGLQLIGTLAVGLAFSLHPSTAFAPATTFTMLTITNRTPASGDCFGDSVAVLGNDRLVVGAHGDNTGATDAGAAYLFNTNGILLATFTNPTPADSDPFGYSVATLGADQMLIGAYGDDTGATDAGAAYLFGASGTLLTTFNNPSPVSGDNLGCSVAALGKDWGLIGTTGEDMGGEPGASIRCGRSSLRWSR